MKTLKTMINVLAISALIGTVSPTMAQKITDTSSTTKANGAGAGNGSSQGAPGAATVSGTGTGTLADSNGSVASSDSGVKSITATKDPEKTSASSTGNHNNWGLLGLLGLLGLFGVRKNNNSRA